MTLYFEPAIQDYITQLLKKKTATIDVFVFESQLNTNSSNP